MAFVRPDDSDEAAVYPIGTAVEAHDEEVTSPSGSTSCLPVQTLRNMRSRIRERECADPICAGGSLALLVNDPTTDPKRNKHSYE